MTLAIFDLDNTLLNDDSDYLWGEYLVQQEIVDPNYYQEKNKRFYLDYQNGVLDIDEFLSFSLHPLTQHSMDQLNIWREDFVETKIKPQIALFTPQLINYHKELGHTLIIISATNFFVTELIAQCLEIPYLLSTKPEIKNNRYTGRYIGIPTFKEGKITALNEWMTHNNEDLNGSYFYSDSINDLPLLEKVQHPIVVNPDDKLKVVAAKNQWKTMDLNQPLFST